MVCYIWKHRISTYVHGVSWSGVKRPSTPSTPVYVYTSFLPHLPLLGIAITATSAYVPACISCTRQALRTFSYCFSFPPFTWCWFIPVVARRDPSSALQNTGIDSFPSLFFFFFFFLPHPDIQRVKSCRFMKRTKVNRAFHFFKIFLFFRFV